nr:hypothetical protein [Tanacetum cinerariifolium]
RLVSDSTSRDVEWEPIKEERLEEPKEGWMLGESKKRLTWISSRMLIVGMVPQSWVTLMKARTNPSEAQHKFISSVISTRFYPYVCKYYFDGTTCYDCVRFSMRRMRELVVKYKAKKVCHEEMVKMPLVDLKVLEDGSFRMYIDYRELRGARVAFEDEFGAAEEREVSCEAQQGRSGVKRKLFGSCRNNMGNEPILASLKGSDNFVVIGRLPVLYAEIGESQMIGLKLEQETTNIVVIKERLKEAKDHQES